MDRRQRKTRDAIFNAFSALLAEKGFHRITVGDIIAKADIGRATFYAHFETKDFLLKAFCEELFCHIFDATDPQHSDHKHIFECDGCPSPFLHLLRHIQQDDRHITALLSGHNNDLFLSYFKAEFTRFIDRHADCLQLQKAPDVPDSFWNHYVTATFVETVRWWIEGGMKESPEQITAYFLNVV